MKISTNSTYISLAILGSLGATSTLAKTDTSTEVLDEIVISDRQGTKIETNIVTLEEKMKVRILIYAVCCLKSLQLVLAAVMAHHNS